MGCIRFLAALLSFLIAVIPSASTALSSGPNRTKVDRVVVHSIGGPECKSNKIKFLPASGSAKSWVDYFATHKVLGIHYVIDKQGIVAKGMPEDEIANHAKGSNDTSIGIELVNWGDGKDPYTLEQVTALIKLLKDIKRRWNIPSDHIYSHEHVDKQFLECGEKRIKLKQDPGENLHLEKLLTSGFQPKQFFKPVPPTQKYPNKSSFQDILNACADSHEPYDFRVVVEDSLVIRAKPTVKSKNIGWLKPNEIVTIHSNSCSSKGEVIAGLTGLWVKVVGDKNGFVFSGFLERVRN